MDAKIREVVGKLVLFSADRRVIEMKQKRSRFILHGLDPIDQVWMGG
jgi:hypothetical protein